MVNLTTLAPDIVAAILDESLPPDVTLFDLAAGTPLLWEECKAAHPEGFQYCWLRGHSRTWAGKFSDRRPTVGADGREEGLPPDEKAVYASIRLRVSS
jgi:hypothetical protein